MSARRKDDMHRLQELVRLHREGSRVREVARLLVMSPNTEREYRRALEAAGLLVGGVTDLPSLEALRAAVDEYRPPKVGKQEVSTAEAWRSDIEKMVERGAGPKAIFDALERDEEKDFTASLWAVKRLCKRIKAERGVRAEDVAIRVTAAPGAEAQVDFGYVGRLYDPERGVERKAWVFVMTLSYSRHQFCRIVFDQTTATWLRLHVEAFEAFGGAPATIRPDNLKAAVIRASFGVADGSPALNRSYRELGGAHVEHEREGHQVRQPLRRAVTPAVLASLDAEVSRHQRADHQVWGARRCRDDDAHGVTTGSVGR